MANKAISRWVRRSMWPLVALLGLAIAPVNAASEDDTATVEPPTANEDKAPGLGSSESGAVSHEPGEAKKSPKKQSEKKREGDADSKAKKAEGSKSDRTSDTEDETPWYLRKPKERTQTQKSSDERGGINPCNTKDPGWGIYDGWSRGISLGQAAIPVRGGVSKSGRFDVMIHFHGHEAVRKEWVKVMDGAVLVGIDLGIGSGAYTQAFNSPHTFKDLIASIEKEVAKKRGLEPSEVKVRKVGLSAWSAGYGSIQQILTQQLGKKLVDTVVLLDGFHTGYSGPDGLDRTSIEPFIEFAEKAKSKKRLMFVSHSSIMPPGYASTTETSNYLIHLLGGKAKRGKPRKSDPMGLELNSSYDSGNFHVRGYDGNDKSDHCAHIGLFKGVLKSRIKPRWKSPKGYGAKKKQD